MHAIFSQTRAKGFWHICSDIRQNHWCAWFTFVSRSELCLESDLQQCALNGELGENLLWHAHNHAARLHERESYLDVKVALLHWWIWLYAPSSILAWHQWELTEGIRLSRQVGSSRNSKRHITWKLIILCSAIRHRPPKKSPLKPQVHRDSTLSLLQYCVSR